MVVGLPLTLFYKFSSTIFLCHKAYKIAIRKETELVKKRSIYQVFHVVKKLIFLHLPKNYKNLIFSTTIQKQNLEAVGKNMKKEKEQKKKLQVDTYLSLHEACKPWIGENFTDRHMKP